MQATAAAAGGDRVAAGLASVLAMPSRLVPPAAHLDAGLIARLGTGPVGLRALDHALRQALGLDRATLPDTFRDRIATAQDLRRACRLTLAPQAAALTALRQLVGAINQVRVRAALLKADRRALEALLGPEVMQATLRPAPALAPLADLADPALPLLKPVEGEAPPPLQDQPLFRQGVALAGALIAAQDALLARLWQARALAGPPLAPPPSPTPAQAEAAWRVLVPRTADA